MEQFIAGENIKRFRTQLKHCTDETQRAQLQQLLAAEEAKLRSIHLGETVSRG